MAVDFLIIGPILYLNLAPKNCIQILKSLNKNYYIIRLSDRLYVYAVHHIAEWKNK